MLDYLRLGLEQHTPKRMKIAVVFLVTILTFLSNAYGQKIPLNLESYKSWTTVEGGGISNDGNFVYYRTSNNSREENTLVVKSTKTKRELTIKNVNEQIFSADSKTLYCKGTNNKLYIVNLVTFEVNTLNDIASFKLFKNQNSEGIAYLTTDNRLILKNKSEMTFSDIKAYWLNEHGAIIVLKKNSTKDTIENEHLEWINLNETNKINFIYSGKEISNIQFDQTGREIIFFAKKDHESIWHYNNPNSKLSELVNTKTLNINVDANDIAFSKDDKYIYFNATKKDSVIDQKLNESLEVWSYEDTYLKSQYSSSYSDTGKKTAYPYVTNIANNKTIQLLFNNENKRILSQNSPNDDYFIIEERNGNTDETYLQRAKTKFSICNAKTGEKINIPTIQNQDIKDVMISPSSKYALYYDTQSGAYFSFNIQTLKTENITPNGANHFAKFTIRSYPNPRQTPAGIIGWTENDESIIIRGTFDIWKIDPSGKNLPLNLTKGIGQDQETVFAPVKRHENNIIKETDKILLTSFNTVTKEYGFYSLDITKKPILKQLNSGNYSVANIKNMYNIASSDEFIKARNSPVYLVLMQSSKEAPNYFYSRDLKTFKPVSNNIPQKEYNWLTSQLCSYKDKNGHNQCGILYKPEDFDPNKKYPIIISYYERQSDALNTFPSIKPQPFTFSVAIAVSNGYLVYLPDINSEFGKLGASALQTVLSSVEYLSKFNWVDTLNMGIAGHSMGGFETNYIITHTPIFKAALTGSGNSELLSMAYDVWGTTGDSKQSYYQYSSPKMKESMADNPNIYIENSPIINIKKVSTPLLIMHNDNDLSVPFRQGRQLFIALRSLKKPVWLLNYKGEGHGVFIPQNTIDYNKKFFDFFDHYLKDKQAPNWMIKHN